MLNRKEKVWFETYDQHCAVKLLYISPPIFPHRLPQCVSEWHLEGALVRGARWKLIPAEGPW